MEGIYLQFICTQFIEKAIQMLITIFNAISHYDQAELFCPAWPYCLEVVPPGVCFA